VKFQARPVPVDAFQIEKILPPVHDERVIVVCEQNRTFHATPAMLSRIEPKPGDYVVIQADGYVYLNPRDVFLRKYEPAAVPAQQIPWYRKLQRALSRRKK